MGSKRLLSISISLMLAVVFIALYKHWGGKAVSARESDSKEISNGRGNIEVSKPTTENCPLIEVRWEFIGPVIEEILSNDVKCSEVLDNEAAFLEYMSIIERAVFPGEFSDMWDKKFVRRFQISAITPEEERKLQEASDGHICFLFPNRTTIDSLAAIWRKYPCSRAAALAMLKISSYVDEGPQCRINGHLRPVFRDIRDKMKDYVADNYPHTWQAELAIHQSAIYNDDRYSIEKMEAYEKHIKYREDNMLYKDRDYCYHIRHKEKCSARWYEDSIYSDYLALQQIYLKRCEIISDKALKNQEKIPDQAIEMYNKQIEINRTMRSRYPEMHADNSGISRCQKIIKEHAPEHYREISIDDGER